MVSWGTSRERPSTRRPPDPLAVTDRKEITPQSLPRSVGRRKRERLWRYGAGAMTPDRNQPQPGLTAGRLAGRVEGIRSFLAVQVMERAWAFERATGQDVISFGVGEPDFGTPPAVASSVHELLGSGRIRYTTPAGMPELREALSSMYAARFGIEVPSRRIFITPGGSGALLLAAAATIDPGDEMLLADPMYPANRNFIHTVGGSVRAIPCGADTNYQLTRDLVAEWWGPHTVGALVASPSNPTGTIVPSAEMRAIVDEVLARDGTLIVDEIYGELVYGRQPESVLSHSSDVFVVNSFSKTWAMTGWRLGWLVCPEWAVDAVTRLTENLYLSPPHAAQVAAHAALQPEVWDIVAERRKEFERRRDRLIEGLEEIGFGIPNVPEGAFYVYAECDRFLPEFGADSYEFAFAMIEKARVAFTPGVDFSDHAGTRHVRFSYTTSMEKIDEGLSRLRAVLRGDKHTIV